MYKVVKRFTDLKDNGYAYNEGDTYPREGFEVSAKRLEELASDKNRRRIPLIEEVVEKKLEPEKVTASDEIEEKPTPKKSSKKEKVNKDAE